MPRLTITLSEERYRALKEAAAKRRKSLVTVIDESLEYCGIKTVASAAQLVARARKQSALTEDAAIDLAGREAQAERGNV